VTGVLNNEDGEGLLVGSSMDDGCGGLWGNARQSSHDHLNALNYVWILTYYGLQDKHSPVDTGLCSFSQTRH
jgi:hypothetical protein